MSDSRPNDQTPTLELIIKMQAKDQSCLAQVLVSQKYLSRLVQAIEARFPGLRGKAGADDAANSALRIVFSMIGKGSCRPFTRREQLWSLLLTVAIHKALNFKRAERELIDLDEAQDLEQVSEEDIQILLRDSVRCLLQKLPNDKSRRLVTLKLKGFEDKEIAQKMNCSVRTIEERWKAIKNFCEKHLANPFTGELSGGGDS